MRFIDDKGKLFGVINLIDLSVIVFILVLVVSVGFNYTARPVANVNKANVNVDIKVLFPGVVSEIIKSGKVLNPGDVVLQGNAVIDKVLEVRPVLDNYGKETIYSNIVVFIKAKCVVLNGEYYCADTPIKINAYIKVSQPLYVFKNGKILNMVVHNEQK
jgi:hypothetical protein